MHDDEGWSLQSETYDIAANGKKHAKVDEFPDIWNISGAGNLDDRVAVLRWQLLKLESGEVTADLTPHWHDLSPDQVALHYTRFTEDVLPLKDARDEKVEEWEQCNSLTKVEAEEKAANLLRSKQAPSWAIDGAKQAAWGSHESKLNNLRAERDVLNLLVSKTDDRSDLRKEFRRLAREQGIECDAIEGIAELNARDSKPDQVEARHSVSAYVTDEDMQDSPDDSVDDDDIEEDGDEKSTNAEEDGEVSVPEAWTTTPNGEIANNNTANEEEMVGALEKLVLKVSTSQTS